MQKVSAEPRLYHLEKQEEERPNTDGTTIQKGGGKEVRTYVFSAY